MSNYVEFEDTIAFHPGYYIEEIIEEGGYTQKDFAKRLGTTPKTLSLLVRGQQNLSADIALKLSKLLGSSTTYWLNLQSKYDSILAEKNSEQELEEEIEVLKMLGYRYFRDNFRLPNLPRNLKQQVIELRRLLGVASLRVLKDPDMAVSFRSSESGLSESNIIKANAMVQLAVNEALEIDTPKYNEKKFTEAVQYALTLTSMHSDFYSLVREAFKEAGVVFVVLPNIKGSKTNGATKRIGSKIMLMVNDRCSYSDIFWFTLLHEVGHIINKDFGISFATDTGDKESIADQYARDALIDPVAYKAFVDNGRFSPTDIKSFACDIERDPGIVVGRLMRDEFIDQSDKQAGQLRTQYAVLASS